VASKQRRSPVQSLARIRADGGGSESLMSETRLQEVQTTRRKQGASGRGEFAKEGGAAAIA
jgi:hypothetical protein